MREGADSIVIRLSFVELTMLTQKLVGKCECVDEEKW